MSVASLASPSASCAVGKRQELIPPPRRTRFPTSSPSRPSSSCARTAFQRGGSGRAMESLRTQARLGQSSRSRNCASSPTAARSRSTWPARRWRPSAARFCSISTPPSLGGMRSFPNRKSTRQPLARIGSLVPEGAGTGRDRARPSRRRSRRTGRCWSSIPSAAGALVNLGTIYYRQRKFAEAEKYYREAIDGRPRVPAGAIQPRQSLRRAGPVDGSAGALPPGARS